MERVLSWRRVVEGGRGREGVGGGGRGWEGAKGREKGTDSSHLGAKLRVEARPRVAWYDSGRGHR